MKFFKYLPLLLGMTILSSCGEKDTEKIASPDSVSKKIIHPTEFIKNFDFGKSLENAAQVKWAIGSLSEDVIVASGSRKSVRNGVVHLDNQNDLTLSLSDIRSDLENIFGTAPNIEWTSGGVKSGVIYGVYYTDLLRGEIEFKIVLGDSATDYIIYYSIEEAPMS